MSSNTTTTTTTTDQGLLSVISDALPGCSYNQQFYDWAVLSGMKSVSKGTACPSGYVATSVDVQPSGLRGNGEYDTCVATSNASAVMSDSLLKGLFACVLSPIGSSGPKKLTWWQWFLIAVGIVIGIMIGLYIGYKYKSSSS